MRAAVYTRYGPPEVVRVTEVDTLLGGRQVRFPLPRHDQDMVRYLGELMETCRFEPVIDRCYPLARIVDADRYVETGQKVGNVVITLDPTEGNGGRSSGKGPDR